MLMLVGYDLHYPGDQKALPVLLGQHGETINLRNGPRFLSADDDETPHSVLEHLGDALPGDALLVAGLGKNGVTQNLPRRLHTWLTDRGARLDQTAAADVEGRHLLAIAYNMRIPPSFHLSKLPKPLKPATNKARQAEFRAAGRRRGRIRTAILNLPDGKAAVPVRNVISPVHALWLVDTHLSLAQVKDRLAKILAPQDELLVVEIDRPAETRKRGWLEEHDAYGEALPVF